MVFQDGSGISWTICKQSTPCFRQITTPRPHYSVLQAGCSSSRPTNSIKALKAQAWYEKYIAVKHFWPENHSSPSPWVVNQGHKLRSRVSTDSTVVGLTSILDRGHLDLQAPVCMQCMWWRNVAVEQQQAECGGWLSQESEHHQSSANRSPLHHRRRAKVSRGLSEFTFHCNVTS